MLEASINLQGVTKDDLADSLRVVLQMIEKEFTKGIDSCSFGGFKFNIEEKPGHTIATAMAAD